MDSHIKDVKPLFASVTGGQKCVFVVDISGSMFDLWGFVSTELQRAVHSLSPASSFNVIAFNDVFLLHLALCYHLCVQKVRSWQHSVVGATASSIDRACAWIGELRPRGSTNTLGA